MQLIENQYRNLANQVFEKDGETYVGAKPVEELHALRKDTRVYPDMTALNEEVHKNVFDKNDGAFEIQTDITMDNSRIAGIDIMNDKGETTKIYLDMNSNRLVMDRTESGLIDFGEQAAPHEIEADWDAHSHQTNNTPMRQINSVNYKNDFALGTWAPLSLCEGKTYHLDIYVDKCSVEIFVNGGRIAMTNLVFPTKPYNNLRFYSDGKATIKNVKNYKLGL